MLKRRSLGNFNSGTQFKPPFKRQRSDSESDSNLNTNSTAATIKSALGKPYLHNFIAKKATAAASDNKVTKKEINELRKKEADLSKQIAQLIEQGYSTEKLGVFIEKLHEYNEIKDIGQMLLGELATIECVTVKSLYMKYGLSLDD